MIKRGGKEDKGDEGKEIAMQYCLYAFYTPVAFTNLYLYITRN